MLFDSNSHVSHNPYEHSRVDTGSENTNYTWVVDNTTTIAVTWKKRFRNALHDHNKWLNEISESHGIAKAYDDYTGIRNVTHIKNVYGRKFCIKINHTCTMMRINLNFIDALKSLNNKIK